MHAANMHRMLLLKAAEPIWGEPTLLSMTLISNWLLVTADTCLSL